MSSPDITHGKSVPASKSRRKGVPSRLRMDMVKRYENGKCAIIGRALGPPESKLRQIRENAKKIKTNCKSVTLLSTTNIKNSLRSKNHRKSITLEVKAEVIKRYEQGERAVDIARALSLAESTIRTILTNAEKIKASCKSTHSLSATKTSRTRSSLMENMEKRLSTWIEEQSKQNVPLGTLAIQEKAKSLYNDLIKESGHSDAKPFFASNGWLQRFKKRSNLHYIKMSSNTESAEMFSQQLKKIIMESGYLAKQIFIVHEAVLDWKCISTKEYIPQEETAPSFTCDNNYCTLLLGGNVEGDFKLMPLMVQNEEAQSALKEYSMDCLPFILKSNPKNEMTAAILLEWLTINFQSEVKEYCEKQNLPFKILLVIDSISTQPPNISNLSENIKVVFFPSGISMQSANQSIVTVFKANYLRHLFSKIIRETGDGKKPTITELLQNINIKDAVVMISESWAEVTPLFMHAVWQEILPESVCDFTDFHLAEEVLGLKLQIVALAREAGFDKMEEAEIGELLELHNKGSLNKEVNQRHRQCEEENEISEVETATPALTRDRLSKAFHHIQEGLRILEKDDPDSQRSSEVARLINDALHCYRELYEESTKRTMQKQLQNSIWLQLNTLVTST